MLPGDDGEQKLTRKTMSAIVCTNENGGVEDDPY